MFQHIAQIMKFFFYFNDSKRSTMTILIELNLNHKGEFYCLNYLCSFETKNQILSHENVCQSKDVCNNVMPFEDTKI